MSTSSQSWRFHSVRRQPRQRVIIVVLLAAVVALALFWRSEQRARQALPFDGKRALADVEYQVALGPRTVGSQAHTQAVAWMSARLETLAWEVEVQETTSMDHPIRNVVARRGQGRPRVILGAHYDSRLVADEDADTVKRRAPVPGANDGASGVAVLLELGRVLPRKMEQPVWLVFFDAEDNGRIPGWDWILGSRAFVAALTDYPDAFILVDMIGDADLTLYLEINSDPELSNEIWEQAAALGYSQFIASPKFKMLDDHIPFLEAGIPAVDLIDFDYPYWHTSQDTPDKLSAESMEAVGATLLAWLMQADTP